MRSLIGLTALLVLLAVMFGVVLPQNPNTQSVNAVQNQVNKAPVRPKGKSPTRRNANWPCDPNSNSNVGCNPNVNWHTYWGFPPPSNDGYNATNAAANVVNAAANANARPAPKKPRKRVRPAMAYSMSLESSLLAGMHAGLRSDP